MLSTQCRWPGRESTSGHEWRAVTVCPQCPGMQPTPRQDWMEVEGTLRVPPGQTLFLRFVNQRELLPSWATVLAYMAQAEPRLCCSSPWACRGSVREGIRSCLPRTPPHPPLAVNCGVSVLRSQKRTVVSPEPLARYLGEEWEPGSAQCSQGGGEDSSRCLTPSPPPCSQTLVLSRGAEGHGDDGLGVPLQGAGAAGHCPHPENCLRLVDDVQDLLRLHALPRQGLLQRRHDLDIMDEEGQRHRFILGEKWQER